MGFTSNIRFTAGATKAINFHKYITGFAEFHSIRVDFSPKLKGDSARWLPINPRPPVIIIFIK